MRDRAWRRHIEEKWVKKRISILINISRWYWRGFEDINGFSIQYVRLKDYIGRSENFRYKTHFTDKSVTRTKVKYSPNKNKTYYRDSKKRFSTREYNKREFLKILKENGIK